jgi:hypothetical protein
MPMADDSEGQRIARACSVDYERLCAGRVPLPGGEDFRKGGRYLQLPSGPRCVRSTIAVLLVRDHGRRQVTGR